MTDSAYTIQQNTVNGLVSTLNSKASVDLSNSPYTTNRILEIPQDIKLELNNGTLTLKAGSKLYKPNGFETDGTTPKFDVVTIASDIVYNTVTTTTGTTLFFLYSDLVIGAFTAPDNAKVNYYFSGNTVPTVTLTYALWYDTANNIVKHTFDNGATWVSGDTLPIAICSYTNGIGVTSIDQIFNGFGYIGSTIFILPGVKVQAPNGKNEDGTYKSNILTQSSVGFTTFTVNTKGALVVRPNSSEPLFASSWHFDFENGYISTSDNIPVNKGACILCGYLRTESLKVVDFTFGNVDSVVNSNEFYQLKDKAVTTDTAQTISGSKQFIQPSKGMSIELIANTNQQQVPSVSSLRQLGIYRNSTYTKGDGYTSWLEGYRGADGYTSTTLCTQRFLEGDSQQILNYVNVSITANGIPVAYTRTPPAGVLGDEIVTAGWVNSKMQVVSALPANPDPNVFYFIPE